MRPPVGGHSQKVFHGRLIVDSLGKAAIGASAQTNRPLTPIFGIPHAARLTDVKFGCHWSRTETCSERPLSSCRCFANRSSSPGTLSQAPAVPNFITGADHGGARRYAPFHPGKTTEHRSSALASSGSGAANGMVSIDVLARDGSSGIAALLGYRRFEGSSPESGTPAPFGAGFVTSGGPHRVEELADLELEAVRVAGQRLCR
jgi:hypothetical protein